MFDRGLLSLADDRRILVSNHINDVDGVRKILNSDGIACVPEHESERPHSRFLAWHREKVFKAVALAS